MPAAPAAGAGPWAERAAGLHFCFWFFDLSPVSQQEPLICTLILRVDEMKMKKEMGPLFYSQPIFLVIF